MPELIIKTLTPLEFLNEESLLKDILDKVNNTADLSKTVFDDSNILLELPDSAVERYVVRRQHSSRAYEVKKEFPAQTLLSLPPSSELIVMYTVDEAENEGTAICIRNFIKSLNKGKIRLGENTTLGKGRCFCTNITADIPEFANAMEKSGFKNEQKDSGQKKQVWIPGTENSIVVYAHSEEGIFIADNSKKTKESSITNEAGEFIIPASTWKGIFRNASNDWASYLEDADNSVIDRMFGNNSKGIKGCLVFYDSVINNPMIISRSRIHIDKFSASIIDDRINKRNYVAGDFKLVIECTADNLEPFKKYIFSVLRDLNAKRINIGADKGIGKGFIEIDNVEVN